MMHVLSARRGPVAFIALYVALALFFLAQGISAWVDADARQDSARQTLRVLLAHAVENAPVAGSGKTRGFVAESETQAIAGFDALLRKTIAASGGVVVSTRSEQTSDASAKNSIIISAVFEADIEVVQAALYRLETGAPAISIDKISMEPRDPEASSNNPLLRVSLSLSSRWSTTR